MFFSLLFASPMAVITLLLQLFAVTMFIPYRVERPARHVPLVTYGLIAANTVIFLLTILTANINLPVDRVEGKREVETLLRGDRARLRADTRELLDIMRRRGAPVPEGATDAQLDEFLSSASGKQREQLAAGIAARRAQSSAGLRRLWQIQHIGDTFLLDPHAPPQNPSAHRAAAPSLPGMPRSMNGPPGELHLRANMLYLWVFGRATEETLGSKLYAGAYVLCGIAAVLLFHLTTMQFARDQAWMPYLGASGAIAGVQGFFALRFYRTPVSIFYIQPISLAIVFVIAAIAGVIGALTLGLIGAALGFFGVWAAFVVYMRKAAFGTFKVASAWAIGVWLVVFNVVPAINEAIGGEQNGVALWAHIGGFGFGMVYALLIGSKEEGAKEYLLEDAQKAYDSSDMETAITRAENLLQRQPENAGAYEVMAKAHDYRGDVDSALDNYELAIQKHLQSGERDAAAAAYLHALARNSAFIMPPAVQFQLASQMARNGDYQNAAENLTKIPFTFPDAPEGELSLLRGAQIYIEHLQQPDMAVQLLQTLVQRHPQTQWMAQVQAALQAAQAQKDAPPPEPLAPVPRPPMQKI